MVSGAVELSGIVDSATAVDSELPPPQAVKPMATKVIIIPFDNCFIIRPYFNYYVGYFIKLLQF
jgi:hypothetical protein